MGASASKRPSTRTAPDGKGEVAKESGGPPPPPPIGLGKIISLSRPEWPVLALAITLRFFSEVAGLLLPLVTARAYNALPGGSMDELDWMSLVSSNATRPTDAATIINETMTFVLILFVLSTTIGLVSGFTASVAGERVVARLRTRLYAHILKQEIGFFDARKSGEIVSRLGSDTLLIQVATTSGLNELIIGVVQVAVIVSLMFVATWQLTAIVFGTLTAWCCVASPFFILIAKITRRYQDALGRAANASTEAIGAMRTVRAFCAEDVEHARYAAAVGDHTHWCPPANDSTYRHGVLKAGVGTGLAGSGVLMLMGAIQVAIWVGLLLVSSGELSLGMFMAFQAYQFQLGFAVAKLGGCLAQFAAAKGGAARVFELLERPPKIPPTGGHAPEAAAKGEIRLKGVTFAYPTREDRIVLSGFNLHARADQTTALVGGSGSGKTTVLSLLLRLYEPREGTITLDGHGVSALDPTWLRSQMALVQQEPVLFGTSIRENVCYGISGANPSVAVTDDEVIDVCKQANAHAFVSEFAEGLSTLVGERGVQLSGGQKQRVAIARALLTKPRVLLLDEATSALDAESERLVQEAIERATCGRTTIVVAHRLSTVKDADQIALVHSGAVADAGTHVELLERCEPYQVLVQRQLASTDKPQAVATEYA